mgnify:CR=1 FL=1
MLAPHFIQLLTSSRPAAIARIKPLVNTPFVFFFAVNTLRDTSGFFNMLLLIYGVRLPPSILFLFFPDIRPAGPGAFFLPPEITLYP